VRELLIVITCLLGRKYDALDFAPDELLELVLPSLAGTRDQQKGEPVGIFVGVLGSSHRITMLPPLEIPDLD
jgi:hypothetical protein